MSDGSERVEKLKQALRRGQAEKGIAKYKTPYDPRRDPRDQLIEAAREAIDLGAYLAQELFFLATLENDFRSILPTLPLEKQEGIVCPLVVCQILTEKLRRRSKDLFNEIIGLRATRDSLLTLLSPFLTAPKFTNLPELKDGE